MIKIEDEPMGTTFFTDKNTEEEIFNFYMINSIISGLGVNRAIMYCSKCNSQLDYVYCYIIFKLREAGLLSVNIEFICCSCRQIKNSLDFLERRGVLK